jgi:hypothetical protein
MRRLIGAGATAVWLWLIGLGLVVLLGTSAASVPVAFLLVGVPAALHVYWRFRPAEPPPPTGPHPAFVSLAVLGLKTPELCLAWRRSYCALVALPAGPARAELVGVRQSILDELERRDGAGFRRWLEAGARAGGDPGRYLAIGLDG